MGRASGLAGARAAPPSCPANPPPRPTPNPAPLPARQLGHPPGRSVLVPHAQGGEGGLGWASVRAWCEAGARLGVRVGESRLGDPSPPPRPRPHPNPLCRTRRPGPLCATQTQIGMLACNDYIILESCIYRILQARGGRVRGWVQGWDGGGRGLRRRHGGSQPPARRPPLASIPVPNPAPIPSQSVAALQVRALLHPPAGPVPRDHPPDRPRPGAREGWGRGEAGGEAAPVLARGLNAPRRPGRPPPPPPPPPPQMLDVTTAPIGTVSPGRRPQRLARCVGPVRARTHPALPRLHPPHSTSFPSPLPIGRLDALHHGHIRPHRHVQGEK